MLCSKSEGTLYLVELFIRYNVEKIGSSLNRGGLKSSRNVYTSFFLFFSSSFCCFYGKPVILIRDLDKLPRWPISLNLRKQQMNF